MKHLYLHLNQVYKGKPTKGRYICICRIKWICQAPKIKTISHIIYGSLTILFTLILIFKLRNFIVY